MREIKFRAWDKVGEEMVDDVIWTGAHAEKYDHNNEDNVICYLPEFACNLMQFTGLKDKNGKEIYEGDIVKVGEEMFEIGWYVRSAAFWLITLSPRNDATRFASAGVPARDWNWLDCGEAIYWHGQKGPSPSVEVIGNIYENPELLK